MADGRRPRLALVFGAAALLRIVLVLAFPTLPKLLSSRPEVATPMTAWPRLQEGVFLWLHNVSPFDGGVYHQAPLLLPIFALFPDYQTNPLPVSLFFVAVDLASARALTYIVESGAAGASRHFVSPRRDQRWTSIAVAAAFLFSPFTIVTCIARATSALTNCAILVAIAGACSASFPVAVSGIALAAYLSMYPILLAIPVGVLLWDRIQTKLDLNLGIASFVAIYVGTLGTQIGALLGASYLLVDHSWKFLASTYGNHVLLTDLTPNIGLWWYFFIEMFDSFRDFFLAVFWLHMVSYAPGLTIKLRKQPLFAVISLLGVFSIFKPYPSVADASLFLSLIPLYRHVFPLFRYGFIAAAALLYATFLGPAFYHLWVYAGSGNANFFYAITLVWSLGLVILLTDSLYAVLRDEVEVERPDLKGQDLVQS